MSVNYTSTFKTTLKSVVVVKPEQLNNDLYMNIKDNLEKRLLGKVFGSYGLIEKIYGINKIGEGKIHQEDNDCNVYFDVDFNCRIIRPTNGNIIIAKIDSISPEYIVLSSGDIKIIVKNKHIGDNFKVEINKYQMINKEKVIYASGSIIEEAEDKEVEKYYDSVYGEIKEDDESVDNTNINDLI